MQPYVYVRAQHWAAFIIALLIASRIMYDKKYTKTKESVKKLSLQK